MPDADCIVKEPPPKPTRIRTSSKATPPGTINAPMLNGNTSPQTRAPIPLPRPGLKPVLVDSRNGAPYSQQSLSLTNDEVVATTGLHSLRKADPPRERDTSSVALEVNNIPRITPDTPGRAPLPPPKPKRISLAPQPKAKPLSLQSVPLQPKADNPTRSTSSPAAIAPVANKPTPSSLSAPINVGRTPGVSRSQELPRPKFVSAPLVASPPPPAKKPRSTEPSMDGQPIHLEPTPQRPRPQPHARSSSPPHSPVSANAGKTALTTPSLENNRVDSTLPAGPTSPGVNPTLLSARSRLRSTSDAKASTSYSVAFPQTTKAMSPPISAVDGGHGFGSVDIRGPNPGLSQLPTHSPGQNVGYGDTSDEALDSGSTAAAVTLAASLHKIQALAHEQTERMKQINYSEKKADLAEVVYEKSSMWRQRGAEWGGIARKAWDDRGGMGGIAGGLADRWKRRADGTNEGQQDYSRPGIADHIFGLPLEEAVRLSKISATTGVPAVISRCIEYLDIMGVEEVGLYRVPGSTSNVARLKVMFDHGHDYDFLQKGNAPQNPHDVATLLKLYFRELPAPVIPPETMATFNSIDFSDVKPQHQQRLKEALGLLPLENYILLGTLCRHLSNLAEYESCTKMNISNLGLIFCPTLQIGSVLFKNLLGGDGGDEERQKGLLLVWSDLERKHEEMENLEMIKDFEMSLELEKEEEHMTKDRSNGQYNHSIQQDYGYEKERNSWEEIDRSQVEANTASPASPFSSTTRHPRVGSDPRRNGKLILSPDTIVSPSYISPSTATSNSIAKPSEAPLDLYDQLMAKEIDEATSTPLMDEDESEQAALRWRRHAREPAINRRTESQPACNTTTATTPTTRHERAPAMSTRY
ncbi:hypothetical protein EC991_010436 [Linnemannia zychae]|nr:hypothetical protein EC991_010436 [Linnemannia zychae]